MRVTNKNEVPTADENGATRKPAKGFKGRLAVESLRGTADTQMSTDEIMALTRGESRRKKAAKVTLAGFSQS